MAVSDTTQSSPPPLAPARQRVPQAGMRGGLGRTLLTAFLILAIGPLSLVGYLAFEQVRNDQQQRVLDRLAVVADLTVAQLEDWAEGRVFSLALIANSSAINELITWLEAHPSANSIPTGRAPITTSQSQDLESIWLYNTQSGQVWPIAGDSPSWQADQVLPAQARFPQAIKFTVHSGIARFIITKPINHASQANFYLVGIAKMPERFFTSKLLNNPESIERLYFASQSGGVFSLSGEPVDTPQTLEALRMLEAAGLSIQPYRTMKDGQGLYINYAGVVVLGAYLWLDDVGCAVVAEQDQTSAMAVSDRFAAGLIAAILAVSLLTAIIAAIVTRQMTRPIVRLSEVALRMAEGDLSQRVPIDRRDEIGILAHVFNKMAADLGELYAGLERKVAERTHELQAAKEQIQYHAWQLSISAEVGRITTSILDLDTLLNKAAHLIRDAFQLDHVGIYLLDSLRKIAFLRESAGRAVPDYERQLRVGGTHPVSQVVSNGLPIARIKPDGQDSNSQCQQLVLPLTLGKRVIGALDLTSYDPIGFSESDQQVLQALAGQLTVAVENARAYGREHAMADEMREVDRLRGQFLARMSHQLATYLNNVIGFSRILLKGLDGPLTELQAKDLTAIRQSGQQLQQLLNDILELANLEVGVIDINPAQVNLDSLISDLRTALPSALVNPQLQLDIQAEQALPTVLADANRLRQVLTNLVVTAAEKSHEGIIRLCVTSDKDHVQFVVNAPAEWDSTEGNQGISLALSRRLVELHDARLRVEQYEGAVTFNFSLAASRKGETDKKEPGL